MASERPDHLGGEIAASAYYSNHDLREMFSRDNAERRRSGGKMLRAKLTAAQDKKCMAKMVKIRQEFAVSNADDVVIKWVQMMIEEGKGEDFDEDLVDVAARAVIPRREVPWDDATGH